MTIRASWGALILALVLLASASLSFRNLQTVDAAATSRPAEIASDGYVSSQTCRSCHPSHYQSWYGSYHRSMTQAATPATVVANFDNVRVNDGLNAPIQLERQGSEYWAELTDPDALPAAGSSAPRIRRQIVMVTGSHQQQVYWYGTDRQRVIGQLPGMYLIADRRWIPRSASLLHPPLPAGSETGRWNAICVNCHATHGKRELDVPFGSAAPEAMTAATNVAELGIACEACHGPGGAHVRMNRNPVRRYLLHLSGEPDPTIVQPAKLDPRRSSQVCGQCHSVWEFTDAASDDRANRHGSAYRPGDLLMDSRFIAQPSVDRASAMMQRLLTAYPGYVRDSFWPDGMIRVSGREYNGLIDSPCFRNATESQRTLSCASCHAMHQSPTDRRSVPEWSDTHQLAAEGGGNQACLQCHPTLAADVAKHTNHRSDSNGSSCYNCHMPYTTYGLLKALRSHQISSPNVAATIETGRPNACNLCHLDKTLQWTSDALASWYGQPRPQLSDEDRSIAASITWLLRGDAGLRAIAAWSLGWKPAQETSGANWMGLYLSQLLEDPYDPVRYIAGRSLRTVPGFGEFPYDFMQPASQRFKAAVDALEIWRRTGDAPQRPELLIRTGGQPDIDAITRLMQRRDNRPVVLRE